MKLFEIGLVHHCSLTTHLVSSNQKLTASEDHPRRLTESIFIEYLDMKSDTDESAHNATMTPIESTIVGRDEGILRPLPPEPCQ